MAFSPINLEDPKFTTLTEGQVPKSDEFGKLIYGGATVDPITGEWTFDQTAFFPQASLFTGPAVKISDIGGFLGIENLADGLSSISASSRIFETEDERDLLFPDGVPKLNYQYLLGSKWVFQFPFTGELSNSNSFFFELSDSDSTLFRMFRVYSATALTGVRIFVENLLPGGDALVWENVSQKSFLEGEGQTLNSSGFSEITMLPGGKPVKVATANVRLRFTMQAQPGDTLQIDGQTIDVGFGSYFYPKMHTYTQDIFEVKVPDFQGLAVGRIGDFTETFKFDSNNAHLEVRTEDDTPVDDEIQPVFTTPVSDDRPEIIITNGPVPRVLNSVTVKHTGTWSPVQVSFNDIKTIQVSLVDGDNTLTVPSSGLTMEANESVVIRLTGAIKTTGSQTQISLLGNVSEDPYASINVTDIVSKKLGIFGSEHQYEADEDLTSTTSMTLQNKITVNTPVIPAGSYRISATISVANSLPNQDIFTQFTLDGVVFGEYDNSPKTGDEFFPNTTFVNRDLTNDTHEVKIDYSAGSGGGSAKAEFARVEVFRIS